MLLELIRPSIPGNEFGIHHDARDATVAVGERVNFQDDPHNAHRARAADSPGFVTGFLWPQRHPTSVSASRPRKRLRRLCRNRQPADFPLRSAATTRQITTAIAIFVGIRDDRPPNPRYMSELADEALHRPCSRAGPTTPCQQIAKDVGVSSLVTALVISPIAFPKCVCMAAATPSPGERVPIGILFCLSADGRPRKSSTSASRNRPQYHIAERPKPTVSLRFSHCSASV